MPPTLCPFSDMDESRTSEALKRSTDGPVQPPDLYGLEESVEVEGGRGRGGVPAVAEDAEATQPRERRDGLGVGRRRRVRLGRGLREDEAAHQESRRGGDP